MPTMSPSTFTMSPSLVFGGRALDTMSDDECMSLLADAVDEHDAGHLDEVAQLIGRLAVPIEL